MKSRFVEKYFLTLEECKNTSLEFKNIEGTSGDKPQDHGLDFDSWIEYWEYETDEKAKCYEFGCKEKSEVVGAHVEVKELNETFILPLCKEHNNHTNTGWMKAKKEAIFVLLDGKSCYTTEELKAFLFGKEKK